MKFIRKCTLAIIILLQLIVIISCRTQSVPENQYLFTGSKFKYSDNKRKPFSDELENYVKQKPNRTLFIYIPFSLWFYNISDSKFDNLYTEYYSYTEKQRNQKLLDSLYVKYNFNDYVGKSRWLDRFFFRNGEAPVLLDNNTSFQSSQNINRFFVNHGWRKAIVKDSIIYNGTKKASILYDIKLGKPTRIDSLKYDIPDPEVRSLYEQNLPKTLILNKRRLDAFRLEKEIGRIENFMTNNGYYNFNELKDEVYYEADTSKNFYKVPLTLFIKKSGDSLNQKFKKFKFKKIDVVLANNSSEANSNYGTGKDVRTDSTTTAIHGYNIVNNRSDYKNRVITDLMVIENDKEYKALDIDNTKRKIYKGDNFNILSFTTEPITDSTLYAKLVMYPKKKHNFEFGFDAFHSKVLNFGISPRISYNLKNLFGNGENLNLSFGGTVGNMQSKQYDKKLFNASEISFQASLNIPRWLLPFNTENLIHKKYSPYTNLSFGISSQKNVGLDRRNYTGAFNYSLTPNQYITHKLTLWNLQFTQFMNPGNYFNLYSNDNIIRTEVYNLYFSQHPELTDLIAQWNNGTINDNAMSSLILNDANFISYLQNSNSNLYDNYELVELRRFRFTQNTLISSIGYEFIYDERTDKDKDNPLYFSFGAEFAGNLLSLFNKSLKKTITSNNKEIHTIFNVPYSQFMKFDFDIRKYWKVTSRATLTSRAFIGVGIPFGNSFSMPFDRNYSVGGSNDVRAWKAFGFGPGTSKLGTKDGFELAALENMKLLGSVEYRFPLNKSFEGAFFIDAGNIWATKKGDPNQFKLDEFYKELGIGGGAGLRYTISYFTLRFDLAYKFHDPTREEGDRWNFKYIRPLKDFQFQFAIGYPF